MTYSLRYGEDTYTIDMDGRAAKVMNSIINRARTTGLICGLVFRSSPHPTLSFFCDPMSPELEGASWQAIGEWLYAKLPPSARQLKAFVAQALLRPSIQEPVEAAFTAGVEATLRARITTLEKENDELNDKCLRLDSNWGRCTQSLQRAEIELAQFKRDHPPVSISYIRNKFEKACTATTEETLLRAYLTLLLDIIKGAQHV